jgi:hypothetical protein
MRYLFTAWLLFLAASTLTFAAADEELLALVPPGATVVTSVDVHQAKNSPFAQYILNRVHTEDHGFEELIQQTGFDPRRDLQNFVCAIPASETDGSESKFAILVRGSFDHTRIRALAKTKGASVQKYGGVDVFINKSDHESTAYGFASPSILVMGNLATVQQILENRSHPVPLDAALQQLIAGISANNDAWFASVMPGSYLAHHVKQANNEPAAEQAINSILQSSGGIQFGDVVRISFDAIARSPKDAQSLADVVKFVASLAQMNRQKGPNAQILATAADEMNLQTEGDAVHLSVSVPESSLEQLANGATGPSIHGRTPQVHR